jgi:hypothetical protein
MRDKMKSAFKLTGIFPFNTNKVINKGRPLKSIKYATSNRHKILFDYNLQTPKIHRDLHQQTQFVLEVSDPSDYNSVILPLMHLAAGYLSSEDLTKL